MGQQWLDVVANNLANTTTTGYKRDDVAFREMYERRIRVNGGAGAEIGSMMSGPAMVGTYTQFGKGPLQMTGNKLDLALDTTEGMFKIETPQGVRFTRDGSFTLNQNGELTTKSGFRVLDVNGNSIRPKPNDNAFSIGGEVMSVSGQKQQIAVESGTFTKIGQNLFISEGDTQQMTDPKVIGGMIEASNVDTVRTMIEMIQVQRIYDMAQRSVQSHDESTAQLIQKATG